MGGQEGEAMGGQEGGNMSGGGGAIMVYLAICRCGRISERKM